MGEIRFSLYELLSKIALENFVLNLAGSPAGTPNEFKKMKPDPNNPDRVLMKDPNGKTISKAKPNGFDEFWKNKHN